MLFNSLTFIVFFIIVLIGYYSLKDWTHRKFFLLMASYVFYGAWNPPFTIILWISTIIDWYAAKWIFQTSDQKKKKFFLLLSLISNLGMLGFFKYGNFFMENFHWLGGAMGFKSDWKAMDIILPVGISFYTFQTLSYTIDVYRGSMKPARSFLDFALYVTFFPQLVAGPIVRAVDFVPQCDEPKKVTSREMGWGLYFMTLGIFQKVVLADVMLSPASDSVFGWSKEPLSGFDAWIGLLAFTGQVFFDFAGYSTCAIGASICLGFLLPDNFRFPFSAIGFSDLWNRWHMSLSTWLRDYLYISMGGSKKGKARTLANLFMTMLIGGFWHGAAWTYVIWGGMHGFFLVVEHVVKAIWKGPNLLETMLGRSILRIITFLFFMMPLVVFRSRDVKQAIVLFTSMFGLRSGGLQILPTSEILKVVLTMFCIVATHWYMSEKHFETVMEKMPQWFIVGAWCFMMFGLIIAQGGSNAFIYFQF